MNIIDYFGTGNDSEYAFLSNFYEHEGWTVEHHYQAAKTDDPEWAAKILSADSPRIAKQLGRRAPMRAGWDDMRISTMRALLSLKFAEPTLAQMLVDTGDAELIEGNWWGDTFWGVCRGHGFNHLGKLLMERRAVTAAMPQGEEGPWLG